jgi:hypothetical protein
MHPYNLIVIEDFPELTNFGFISSVEGMVLYDNGIHQEKISDDRNGTI